MAQTDTVDQLGVDFLILADGAQVVGGKLFVLGGGWDRIQPPSFPHTLPQVGLALGIRVPWLETNRQHTFVVRGMSADQEELFRVEGGFEVGRPPGLPKGMSQLFQVAMQLPLPIPKPGQYVIDAEIDGGKARAVAPYFAVDVSAVVRGGGSK